MPKIAFTAPHHLATKAGMQILEQGGNAVEALADCISQSMEKLGHEVEVVDDLAEMMGHAGAIMLMPDGQIEAGSDPRSDGLAMVSGA